MGREEIEVMIPVLDRLRAEGMNVSAPLPADTLFTPDKLAQCDCVLTMYHDQGLPVLKHASFGQGVNVTLGLPVIRTSVDHGTALDLAGTGKANSGSLLERSRSRHKWHSLSVWHRNPSINPQQVCTVNLICKICLIRIRTVVKCIRLKRNSARIFW